MKRRILSFVLAFLLVSILAFSVSANSQLARVVDQADLLTSDQELQLEEMANSFRMENSLDVVILTVNGLDGKSVSAYADDYYDYNGYGVGPDCSGLILVVAMAEREVYIATTGEAIALLNDDELDSIIADTSYWLSEGEYYDAFETFLNFTPGYLDEGSSMGVSWLLSMLVGAVAAGITVLIMRSTMNTRRRQYSAGDYLKEGSYDLKNRQDIFLYSNVTKVKREQNNSSSGGKTTVHTGSSGRSHGGRGGKF